MTFQVQEALIHTPSKLSGELTQTASLDKVELLNLRRVFGEADAKRVHNLTAEVLAAGDYDTKRDRRIFNSLGVSYADPRMTGKIFGACFRKQTFGGYGSSADYFNGRVENYCDLTETFGSELTIELGRVSIYGAKEPGRAENGGKPSKSFFSAKIRRISAKHKLSGEKAEKNKKLAKDYAALRKEVQGFFKFVIPDLDRKTQDTYLRMFSPHISLGYVRDYEEACEAVDKLNESGVVRGLTIQLQPVEKRPLYYPA